MLIKILPWWLYLKAKQDTILELANYAYSLLIHSLESDDDELIEAMLEEAKQVIERAVDHVSILTDFFGDLEMTQNLEKCVQELIADYQRVRELLGGDSYDDQESAVGVHK